MIIPQRPLGQALRRWRALNRVKQSHAAELFGVDQSTVSRWECGILDMTGDQRARAETLLGARLSSAGDAALARLVEQSSGGAHLMCDYSHRLLALSAMRRREFGIDADELMGRSLWPFITEELAKIETSLEAQGWFDLASPPSLVAFTGANCSDIVPIIRSHCRLTRLILSDGAPVRLIETLN